MKAYLNAIEDSLRRLQIAYIDLYQIHRFDHAAPIEETMKALHETASTLYRTMQAVTRYLSFPND